MTWNPNITTYEFSEFTSAMKKAWSEYVEKSNFPDNRIRPEILTSWERSKNFGVDPFQQQVQQMVKQEELFDSREKNETLLSFAIPDMKYLSDSLTGSQTIVTITDKNGVILHSFGDSEIIKKGEKVRHMPGAVWSEEIAGTNAIGTVIKTKKPVQVLFTEHFCTGWHDWFCAAAPILNPFTNELLGVFDISGKLKNVNPHTFGLAISKANHISKYIEKNIFHYGLQMNPFMLATLGSIDDGILIADAKKRILKMNAKLESYLWGRELQTIEGLYELDQLVNLVLEGNEKFVEQEITLHETKRKYICSVHPVIMDYEILGVVIRFRESRPPSSALAKNTSAQPNSRHFTRYRFDDMIGTSAAFVKVVNQAKKAALLDSTLFLTGETGTGKEFFAQAIHHASERRNNPFVAINCGAMPRELIESELFGYEPGAFTGAKSKGSPGKFELAQGGTIFLDEIGDMPLHVQVHLLRVLEEKVVTRIGGEKPIAIDVRVIAATHKNLVEAIRKGEFREDLLYRLRVIQLRLPALRERNDDIPLLVHHFLQQLGPKFGKGEIHVPPETMQCLATYPWPGNIRELKNVIEQSLFNMEENRLLPCHLPPELMAMTDNPSQSEKDQLVLVMKMMNGNIKQAAEKLGISRATMYRKMKQFHISKKDFQE